MLLTKEEILNPRVYPGSSHDPYWADIGAIIGDSQFRVYIRLDTDEIGRLGYPVIVEQWDKFVGPQSYGRQRRAWLTEFTPEERKKAGSLYRRFYNWYLRSGAPQSTLMTYDTYRFIRRLADFFASA